MSLMSSIFGAEAPAAASASIDRKDASPDDLFAKVSVPPVLHKHEKAKSAKRGEGANAKDDDGADQSSSDGPSNSQQTAEEDGAQKVDSPSASKNTKKKTKEQLKEEEGRTVFVGNLPPDIGRRALAGIFKPCGAVVSARLRSMAVTGVKLPPEQAGNQNMMRKVCVNTGKVLSDTPKKSAQGYVVFESIDSVQNALKMNNTQYESHTIRVDRADPTIEPSRSVFVGNLPYGADEESLREHFLEQLSGEEDLNEREGSAISGVRIIRDKETQLGLGFGYVTLRDATLVPGALQLHGSTYMRRELRVMICGKRFKGNRGSGDDGKKGRRSFEGQRATGGGASGKKRKSGEGTVPGGNGGGKAKKRRARGEKKSTNPGGLKSGMSKRAATEQKVNKRVKKLQQRAAKGMGKKKK